MAKGGQEKGKGFDFNVFLIGGAGAILLIWMFWFVGHNFITWLGMRTRQWELLAMGWVAHFFIGDNAMQTFGRSYANSPTANLSFDSFLQVMKESGTYVVYLYTPILAGIGVYLWRLSPTENFKKSHTMASLAKQEAAIWPEIRPALIQNLVKGDIRKGPWKVSQTEWEFARAHNLVSYPDGAGKDPFAVKGAPSEKTSQKEIFNREAAASLFVEQLGNRWRGVEYLPPYLKGIYAALGVRVAAIPLNDTKLKKAAIDESDTLLRKMASDYADAKGDISKVDFSWADPIIKKNASSEFVEMALLRHAYVFTIIATMLQVARADGVVASSMFIWLRPVDRRMWYILENVGGYCFVPECAGIAAHWLMEKEVGTRLMFPSIMEAVDGLELGLGAYQEEDEKIALFK